MHIFRASINLSEIHEYNKTVHLTGGGPGGIG